MRVVTVGSGLPEPSFPSAARRLRAPSARSLARVSLFPFASAPPTPIAQAQSLFFSTFVSVGPASRQADVTTSPQPIGLPTVLCRRQDEHRERQHSAVDPMQRRVGRARLCQTGLAPGSFFPSSQPTPEAPNRTDRPFMRG